MQIVDPFTGKTIYRKKRHRFDEEQTPRSLNFTCFHNYQFLSKDRTRYWFLEALEEGRQKFPVDLWAWVLMPEHVHLLVYPRERGKIVGPFQGFVKEKVARKAIAWMAVNAPEWIPKITVLEGETERRRFWQAGGGYDRNIEELTTLTATIEYIHRNPLRRGLVENILDWEWSSARWYAGWRDVLIEMDRTLPMFVD